VTDLRWFAFTTRAQREPAAAEELARFAAETKLPQEVKRWTDKRGRERKRTWPLMIGFAFGGFETQEALIEAFAYLERTRLADVRTSLRRIVATARGVPLELQGNWDQQMDYSKVELPGAAKRPLAWDVDDEVLITEGPFRGMKGPVCRVNGERARIVLALFHGAECEIGVRQAVLHKRAEKPSGTRSVPLDAQARRRS
jgi:hypothetical protein